MVSPAGRKVSETRNLDPFTSIDLQIPGQAIVGGGQPGVTIIADEHVIGLITTKVVNGELKLGIVPGSTVSTGGEIRFEVYGQNIEGFTVSSCGSIDVLSDFHTKRTYAAVSSTGSIRLSATSEVVYADVTGTGTIDIRGTADWAILTMSGAGSITSEALQQGKTQATVSGCGSVTCWTKNHLDVRVSGVGSVAYKGDPAVWSAVTGLGSVVKM